MDAVLVDAGPLVAIINADDRHHAACRAVLAGLRDALVTVIPALTEAAHLLGKISFQAQDKLLELAASGSLGVASLGVEDWPRIRALMSKYRDLPMDLADAALVRVAERDGIATILTTDKRDFRLYRPSHVRAFEILP